jgi:DNA invertase Pin-like site-specific DNA recombinase
MLIGYARVSTRRQRLDLQHRALEAARCDLIISEWRSGDSGIGHGLGAAMECCGAGDLLVVWKLDRLGRNVMELMGVIERLRRRGAGLVSRFILRISATR